eukprot:1105287-Prorocentrum_minimum.AAC.1
MKHIFCCVPRGSYDARPPGGWEWGARATLDCEDADRVRALVLQPERAEYESGPSRPDGEDPPEGGHAPEEYA